MRSTPNTPTVLGADQLAALADQARAHVRALDADTADEIDQYLERHARWPEGHGYRRVPERIAAHVAWVDIRGSITLVGAFHRAAILVALARTRAALPAHPQWGHTVADFDQAAAYLVASLAATPTSDLTYESDAFARDIAFATGRLRIAGGLLVDPRAGLDGHALLRGGIGSVARAATLATLLGGRAPFYELYPYARLRHRLGAEARVGAYLAAAEAMARDPQARGLIATAWYFAAGAAGGDPEVARLRGDPEAGGATFLRVGGTGVDDADDTGRTAHLALLAREARRLDELPDDELLDDEADEPRRHLMVWPRAALLDWARARRAAAATTPKPTTRASA